MNKLETMNSMFELSQRYMLNFHEISSSSLSVFSVMLSQFERMLNEEARGDACICELVNDLRRFRFYVTASPLPFINSQDQLDRLKLKRLAIQCGLLFPNLKEATIKLVDASIAVIESNEKPILDFLNDRVQDGVYTGLVVKVAKNVDLVSRIIRESLSSSVTVVSPLALKQGAFFEQIIIVGPPHWYPEHLYNCPRARSIDTVTYAWQQWSHNTSPHLSGGDSRLSTLYAGCTVTEQKNITKSTNKIAIDQIDRNYLVLEESILRTSSNHEKPNQVAATLVALAGGKCIFFEKHTISNIWVLAFNQEEKVTRLPVQQLDTECYLLIRTGTERDVIHLIADKLLGVEAPSIRNRHSEWKKGLQKLVYKYGHDRVIRELRKKGSSRANYINLRNWMSEDNIKPRDREDFSAIINILKYGERETSLWKEAEILAKCHLQAGTAIRQQLLKVVNQADLSKLELEHTMVFPLPGAEEASFTSFKVEYIFNKDFYVEEHKTRILLDLEGA